ncbi:hypothetical protein Pen02_48180 [Plantactinospora endophytica]|uniref:Uncharacterized protein n=1 Tax=Plantactinospora endophytica TaxID=673535 RepID=A0ABQ4E6E7_9ACTN|nr:hypothetical protein Pen02_48180 [Plantactinospora endophytica]
MGGGRRLAASTARGRGVAAFRTRPSSHPKRVGPGIGRGSPPRRRPEHAAVAGGAGEVGRYVKGARGGRSALARDHIGALAGLSRGCNLAPDATQPVWRLASQTRSAAASGLP